MKIQFAEMLLFNDYLSGKPEEKLLVEIIQNSGKDPEEVH